MNSDDDLIRGLKSRINELCDAREIDKAIETFSKAKQLCLPSNPLYNGVLQSHSHLLSAIKSYVHFVLSPDCRIRPYKGKITQYMDYAGMTLVDLNPSEAAILQSL